jgi:hypothetical protein
MSEIPKLPSWECVCSCGTVGVVISADALRAGHTRSCDADACGKAEYHYDGCTHETRVR